MLRKCKLNSKGSNPRTLKKIIKEYNLSEEQMNKNRSKLYSSCARKTHEKCDTKLEDVLNNKVGMTSYQLLRILEKANIKEHKCERCGITEWQGEHIALHLHHKDGDHNNNQLDNLEVLCPNCHSQTDNFAGRNSKRSTKKKVKIEYSPIIEESDNSNLASENTNKNLCTICNREICFNNNLICTKCRTMLIARKKRRNNPDYNITQVVDYYENEHKRFKEIADIFDLSVSIIINDYCKYKGIKNIRDLIGREKLKQMIRQYSFLYLSAEWGVSDKAITKWCINYNLPYRKKDINKYTDKEWEKI